MPKIADYVELRRKSLKFTQNQVSDWMQISHRSYKRRLETCGFTEEELLKAAKHLQFDIILLPKEADIFTA